MEESKAKNGLQIGQKIKHSRIVLYKKENQKRTIVEKWTVIGLYPYIFRVKWDNHNWTECFPSELRKQRALPGSQANFQRMLESTHGERIQPL